MSARRSGSSFQLARSMNGRKQSRERHVLITGGAGFVGCNLANRIARSGERVLLFDNLSRAGVEQNVAWLREQHPESVHLLVGDVRDLHALEEAVQHASAVFHLAAQVAVTTSLSSPIHDFEVNARGTLNLLESLRALRNPPPLIFTSTNKVYGCLRDVPLALRADRYEPARREHARGISETQPLEFYSPYGCSKGAADQYVLDYAQTYGLPAVVLRMSCIYGPHQFGTEDQGWVAHFLIQALNGRPITIYGDGKQVRDILYIEDLLDAFALARENVASITGRAFNIGGGSDNTTSLLELVKIIGQLNGAPRVKSGSWRPGDQRYYVSDFSSFAHATGWRPKVSLRDGIARLQDWLLETQRESPAKLATA
ncbi:MAG: SDR family NAD(P)-dependent oxidoreductase [Verrucomicrobia bacterium]|nr:SDR family NAD(P)-dependent oxidoreductase [Verrucomicrobiota bacterium]